jgi:phosphoribosyl 1,2-cyclic phosphate phosphodiesterase
VKILFLGTSAAWPLPRLNCSCPICSSSDPKDKRWRASILVDDVVQIDTGPDFYHQYQRAKTDFDKLKYLFISHGHPDHYFGLFDVAKIYKKHPEIFIFAKNRQDIVKRISDLTITMVLRPAKIFTERQKIKLENGPEITPILVNHSTDTQAFGFIFRQNRKKVVYIPDFRQIPDESLKVCQKADTIIWDGSTFYPAGPLKWGHMPIIESIKLAKKLKTKEVYYTHIGHGPRMGNHQTLEKKIRALGGKNFHVAWDGLKLEI